MPAQADYVNQKNDCLVPFRATLSNMENVCFGGQSGETVVLVMPPQLKWGLVFSMRDRLLHRLIHRPPINKWACLYKPYIESDKMNFKRQCCLD
jgi:hypothetical protein